MKFVELTSATNGKPIKFKLEDIVAMVDHLETKGDTHETMSFIWVSGMQEAFGVKEPTETIINRMRDLVVA